MIGIVKRFHATPPRGRNVVARRVSYRGPRDGDGRGAHHVANAERPQQLQELIDFLRCGGRLDGERRLRVSDDARAGERDHALELLARLGARRPAP